MLRSSSRGRGLGIALVVLGCQAVGAAVAQDMTHATREHVRKSTVMVIMKIPGSQMMGFGTGEFINGTGLFMTNNHVVDPNHDASVEEWQRNHDRITTPDYKVVVNSGSSSEVVYDAELLHQTEPGDMAILQAKTEDGELPDTSDYVRFLSREDLSEAQKVWIFGFPGGLMRGNEVVVTAGLIQTLHRTGGGSISYVETDATANPGNSGGPMVNVDGKLIGLLTRGFFKEGTKNTTGAVPVELVRQFIRSAFLEGRIHKGIDMLPFVEIFTDQNGFVNFPTYPRKDDECFVHFANSNVRGGTMKTDLLKIETDLGDFDVPLDKAAYLFVRDGAGTFIMDGGDMLRFPVKGMKVSVQFGSKMDEIQLSDLEAIAFTMPEQPVQYAREKGTWLEADGSRLGLSSIKGDVKISGGVYQLAGIVAIQASKRGMKLRTREGEQIEGDLNADGLTGKVLWCDEPIVLKLNGVKRGTARPIDWRYVNADGRRFVERLELEDDDLTEIAALLESPDWEKAKPLIAKAGEVSSRSREGRRQLELFEAVEQMRAKDFDAAREQFKRIRSKSYDVGWVAESYLKLLDEHPGGTYHGEPLTEPDVVWRASTEEANRVIADVEARMEHLDELDYKKQTKELEDLEEALDTANRLQLGIAQGKLVELLKKSFDLHVAGYGTLVGEYNEAVDRHNSEHVRSAQVKWERRLRSIRKRLENCEEEINRVYERLGKESAGFNLAPPKLEKPK